MNKWLSDFPYIYNYQSTNSNGRYMYSPNKFVLSYLEKPHLDKVKHKTIYSNLGVGRNVKKKIYRPHITCTYESPNTEKIVLHNMCTRKNLDVFSFYVKDLYKIPKKIKKRYKRKSWSSSWIRYYFPRYLKRVEFRLKDLQQHYKKETVFKMYNHFFSNVND